MKAKLNFTKSDKWIGFRLEGTIIKGSLIDQNAEINIDTVTAMRQLSIKNNHRLKILTHRADSQKGRNEVRLFLIKHRIPAGDITNKIDSGTYFIVDLQAPTIANLSA
jgi:hypothetical protein